MGAYAWLQGLSSSPRPGSEGWKAGTRTLDPADGQSMRCSFRKGFMVKEVWEMQRRISFFYAVIHGSLVKALSEELQKKTTLSDSNKFSKTFDLENCSHHFPPKNSRGHRSCGKLSVSTVCGACFPVTSSQRLWVTPGHLGRIQLLSPFCGWVLSVDDCLSHTFPHEGQNSDVSISFISLPFIHQQITESLGRVKIPGL